MVAAGKDAERPTFAGVPKQMITHGPDEALKLRALAARFRALAAETVVEPYRHKFEETAADLEQAALGVESRRPDLKQVS
jgi:hypothetical protein